MHVILAGASGLIGSALAEALGTQANRVTRLVRRAPRTADEVQWEPGRVSLDPRALEGADAVVALGGASIGKLPWSEAYRKQILDSRVIATRTIADALEALGEGAPAFLSASAVGYYGSAPGRVLDESSPAGDTFLARVCVEWEREALRAEHVSRVALLRTAMVLHPEGVLRPLMLLTKLGISGPIGGGQQIWPWISLDDEVRAIMHVLTSEISGPVNLVAPEPANNRDIGGELARQLRRPFIVPAPAFAVRAALGKDAADSLLLADAHVVPSVLEANGFTFAHPDLESAFEVALREKRG
ncbi:MAG: TIGR01777 family oxidoreductase [Ancrocorticia sp.]